MIQLASRTLLDPDFRSEQRLPKHEEYLVMMRQDGRHFAARVRAQFWLGAGHPPLAIGPVRRPKRGADLAISNQRGERSDGAAIGLSHGRSPSAAARHDPCQKRSPTR